MGTRRLQKLPQWIVEVLADLQARGFTPPEDGRRLMRALIDLSADKLVSDASFEHIQLPKLSAQELSHLYALLLSRKDGKASAARKAGGAFYTPGKLVHELVEKTLTPLHSDANVRVIDPSCGCGNFLEAASAFLHASSASVFGADIDDVAVDICGLSVRNALVATANALLELPWKGEFDAVIGNPPYVFTRSGAILSEEKKAYAKRYRCGRGRISLSALFLERGIELLRSGGRLGFVIPATLLRAAYFEDLRRFILESCSVEEIRIFGPGVFSGATTEVAAIVLQRETDAAKRNANIVRVLQKAWCISISQQEFFARPGVNLAVSPESHLVMPDVECVSLGELLQHSCTGIQTWKLPKREFISEDPLDERYRPLVEGRDVDRFKISPSGRYILYDPSVLNVAHDEAIFNSPEKILLQRVSGGKRPLKAALDTDRLYPYNSLNTLISDSSRITNLRLLAFLNSRLAGFLYRQMFTGGARLTVNIALKNLKMLPVVKALLDNPGLEAPDVELMRKVEQGMSYQEFLLLSIPHPQRLLDWLSREIIRLGPDTPEFKLLDTLTDYIIFSLYTLSPADVEHVCAATV